MALNILFDGNYLFHKTFSVFATYYRNEDMREVLKDKEKQQILMRKCIIDMCFAINKFKDVKRVAFTIDSSSWRYELYANYKYSLTKVRDAYYAQFLECLQMFEELLKKRGIIVSRVQGAEGDDLMYIWSIYFGLCLDENLVIITGDSDIRQIITDNVSLFANNSKNLKMYCSEKKKKFWENYLDNEISVVAVKPFEILLYKVIMGDGSDNIPKLKKGFGEKAFHRFIEYITPYQEPKDVDILTMARWITDRFGEFVKMSEEDLLGNVLFNLKMVWLNVAVYNETDYQTKNGKSLLENMLDDVNAQKMSYSYNGKYNLESFYNMVIQ